MAGLGGLQGVEQHRAGIGALMLADDVHTGTVRPDLQLVGGGGAERIAGAQQHLLALRLEAGGQLADGRGLAHAVDADEQQDGRRGGHVQRRVAHGQILGQNLTQRVFHLIGSGEPAIISAAAQLLYGARGHGGAHIAQDQVFLQLVVKLLTQRFKGHGSQPCRLQLAENTHSVLLT